MELFLDLLNAIVCYSCLPVDALLSFVTTLCHTLNVERFCEKSWQVRPIAVSICIADYNIFSMVPNYSAIAITFNYNNQFYQQKLYQ